MSDRNILKVPVEAEKNVNEAAWHLNNEWCQSSRRSEQPPQKKADLNELFNRPLLSESIVAQPENSGGRLQSYRYQFEDENTRYVWPRKPANLLIDGAVYAGASYYLSRKINLHPAPKILIGGAVTGALLTRDSARLRSASDSMEQAKYELATSSDMAMGAGLTSYMISQFGRGKLLGKFGTYGKAAMGIGVVGRFGAEFIPTTLNMSGISHTDTYCRKPFDK